MPHNTGIVGLEVPVRDGGSCSVAWTSGTDFFWYCLGAHMALLVGAATA